ncbi:predicted protein [Histoplasma capsulatum H143]|uniref:Uncharacterized protein n=1 Tax=Ajellomyces capsulatus (strain H143) TaxID=544712 RepID=C6HSX3_AJECH|nr:predicted protein [Histoplasma capsulatum H143]
MAFDKLGEGPTLAQPVKLCAIQFGSEGRFANSPSSIQIPKPTYALDIVEEWVTGPFTFMSSIALINNNNGRRMKIPQNRDSRILLLFLHQLRSMPSTVKAILFTNRVRMNPDADEYSKARAKCTRLYGVFVRGYGKL